MKVSNFSGINFDELKIVQLILSASLLGDSLQQAEQGSAGQMTKPYLLSTCYVPALLYVNTAATDPCSVEVIYPEERQKVKIVNYS